MIAGDARRLSRTTTGRTKREITDAGVVAADVHLATACGCNPLLMTTKMHEKYSHKNINIFHRHSQCLWRKVVVVVVEGDNILEGCGRRGIGICVSHFVS